MKHDTVENCTVHMHKQHGFFIPDVEYLKDAKGILTYLGLKVVVFHYLTFCLAIQKLMIIMKFFFQIPNCLCHRSG